MIGLQDRDFYLALRTRRGHRYSKTNGRASDILGRLTQLLAICSVVWLIILSYLDRFWSRVLSCQLAPYLRAVLVWSRLKSSLVPLRATADRIARDSLASGVRLADTREGGFYCACRLRATSNRKLGRRRQGRALGAPGLRRHDDSSGNYRGRRRHLRRVEIYGRVY